MNRTVLASLLRRHHDYTIRTACSVYCGGCTVLENVKRGNVVGIDISKVAARHTVDDNQRTKTGRTRGDTTYLDACLIIGVAGTSVCD